MWLFFERYFDFNIATRHRCIHSGNNASRNKFDHRPLRMLQDDEGKPTVLKILLITDVLVGCNHEFKSSLFSGFDQLAVGEFLPAMRPGFVNGVTA